MLGPAYVQMMLHLLCAFLVLIHNPPVASLQSFMTS